MSIDDEDPFADEVGEPEDLGSSEEEEEGDDEETRSVTAAERRVRGGGEGDEEIGSDSDEEGHVANDDGTRRGPGAVALEGRVGYRREIAKESE